MVGSEISFGDNEFGGGGDRFADLVHRASRDSKLRRINTLGKVVYNPLGGDEDVKAAQWLMSEDNHLGGVHCSYYDYTYHNELTGVVLKLSRDKRSILITSIKDAAFST